MRQERTTWRTSSYSTGSGGNCVELHETPQRVLLRDTQHRQLGYLSVPTHEWHAFLAALRCGEI